MSKIQITEEELRKQFIQFYRNKKLYLICEVPVFCRSVDLVKYDKKSYIVSAIEFKINSWKKAVEQVLNVSISFDYLEICIIKPKTSKQVQLIINTCKEIGIGLYFFNSETLKFSYDVKPKKVDKIWEAQKQQVVQYIKEVKSFE